VQRVLAPDAHRQRTQPLHQLLLHALAHHLEGLALHVDVDLVGDLLDVPAARVFERVAEGPAADLGAHLREVHVAVLEVRRVVERVQQERARALREAHREHVAVLALASAQEAERVLPEGHAVTEHRQPTRDHGRRSGTGAARGGVNGACRA
jgi:hypothetical protein